MYSEALLGTIAVPPIVSVGSRGGEEGGVVEPSMTMAAADGAKPMVVPGVVMAGAPGMSVWPPIMYSEALLGIICLPPIVSVGSRGGEERGVVEPSMTMAAANGAKTIVPEVVMAGAPGISVCPPIIYSEALLKDIGFSPIFRSIGLAAAVLCGLPGFMVGAAMMSCEDGFVIIGSVAPTTGRETRFFPHDATMSLLESCWL